MLALGLLESSAFGSNDRGFLQVSLYSYSPIPPKSFSLKMFLWLQHLLKALYQVYPKGQAPVPGCVP